jgi:type IV pilus assembly protein PilC
VEFVCRLGTQSGQILEEIHHGGDAKSIREELERRGYHVFEVRPRGVLSRLTLPVLRGGHRMVPLRDLMLFNQELAALLHAGLPLLQSLDLVLERIRNPSFHALLEKVRERVDAGADFSTAVEEFSDQFPPLYPSTLKAGERSGEMERVIRRFVRHQRLVMEARRKVISALVYPAVLVGLSLAMIAVMTVFVMPRFSVFYADLQAELPFITRASLAVSHFVRDNWIFLGLGVAALVIVYLQWARSAAGALTLDRWKLSIPFLGAVFQRMSMSEFCRSLSTLLSGGMTAVQSLQTAVASVGNRWIRSRLEPIVQSVREGSSLHEALAATGVASEVVVDMSRVGESTGALDTMLSNVADFLDEEVETLMERLLALLEPAMMIFMGVIVAILLLSVYLPLFSVLGQVGN